MCGDWGKKTIVRVILYRKLTEVAIRDILSLSDLLDKERSFDFEWIRSDIQVEEKKRRYTFLILRRRCNDYISEIPFL